MKDDEEGYYCDGTNYLYLHVVEIPVSGLTDSAEVTRTLVETVDNDASEQTPGNTDGDTGAGDSGNGAIVATDGATNTNTSGGTTNTNTTPSTGTTNTNTTPSTGTTNTNTTPRTGTTNTNTTPSTGTTNTDTTPSTGTTTANTSTNTTTTSKIETAADARNICTARMEVL
jgi:hypothetical protein